MKKVLQKVKLTLVALTIFCPSAVFADEGENVQCSNSEVRVCFADGECVCSVRQIEPSDPTPQISNCEDPEDLGICN